VAQLQIQVQAAAVVLEVLAVMLQEQLVEQVEMARIFRRGLLVQLIMQAQVVVAVEP
jgi:hypothetical protein